MSSKKIFLSHAVKNKVIADKLVDLLETGIGVSSNDVFCSSLEGLGIPSGANFVDFIKGQIISPRLVLLLLTPDYLSSQFCLCELGASWALSNRIVPIIVPPITYENIKAVLTGKQLLKIDDKDNMNQMQQEIIESLDIEGKSFSRWEIKRDEFLADIKDILPLEADTPVSRTEFEKIKKDYQDSVKEIKELIEDNDKKDSQIKAISLLKDKEEINEIIQEDNSEKKEFEELIEKASDALGEFTQLMRISFYYNISGKLGWKRFERSEYDDIKDLIENDFLVDEEPYLSLNEEDPKIDRAIRCLGELKSFIENDCSGEFYDEYKEEYDHLLKYDSKRFWKQHLI